MKQHQPSSKKSTFTELISYEKYSKMLNSEYRDLNQNYDSDHHDNKAVTITESFASVRKPD